jgi:hypothetical protein
MATLLQSINEALAAKARIGTLLQHVVLAVLIGAANMSGDVIYNTYLAETIDDYSVALGGSSTTTTALPVGLGLDGAGVCAYDDGFDQITDQVAEYQQQTAGSLAEYQQQTAGSLAEYQQQMAGSLEQLVVLMVALVNATLASK